MLCDAAYQREGQRKGAREGQRKRERAREKWGDGRTDERDKEVEGDIQNALPSVPRVGSVQMAHWKAVLVSSNRILLPMHH